VFEHEVLLVLHDYKDFFSVFILKNIYEAFFYCNSKVKISEHEDFFEIKFNLTKPCFRKKSANRFTNKNIFTFVRKHLMKIFSEQVFLIRTYYKTRIFVFFQRP